MAYFKRFTAFLGILLVTSMLCGANLVKPVTEAEAADQLKKGVATVDINTIIKNLQDFYSKQLNQIGVNLRPGSEHRDDDSPTATSVNHCNSIVYKTLLQLPAIHRDQLKDLILFYTPDGGRGLGGGNEIILRCLNVNDAELSSVLVHEIGHLVDSGYLAGTEDGEFSGFYDFDIPVTEDDLSSMFYKISWKNEKTQRSNSSELDFVSLYGMTDPFEDFAETYVFYRLHGAEFRELAKSNYPLWRKYRFMKKYVFAGQEFNMDSTVKTLDITKRNYDSTVLPFDLAKFIG